MLRRILLIVAGALALVSTPVAAQDAAGYWAGTLAVTPTVSLRLGVAIARDGAGALSGTADSPDQSAYDIPLAGIEADGARLAFSVPAVGARFEGRWNAALSAWEGTFVQSGQVWPLVLRSAAPPERTARAPLPADWAVPDDGAIGAAIEARLAGREGAGMVVGVIEPTGTRIVARGAGMNGDTMFEIGSMTKVFTALLMADMVRSGEVALDDPVERYLPNGVMMPWRGGDAISLRHLSMHTSGLPRLPDNMPYANPADPYADYTEDRLTFFLNRHLLARDPGAQYEYSNLGVGLLGYALGRAGDREYGALLRERVLEPLGLRDTAIVLSPAQQARFAAGHDEYLRPAPPWNLGVLAGAGALRSSANDMLLFLAAALDPASPIGPSMELLLSDRRGAAGAPQTALGWFIVPPPSGEVLHHGGGTGGFRTEMALQPSRGRAVVVLTNAAVEPAAEDFALHLLAGTPLAPTSPVPPPPPPAPVRAPVALSAAELDQVAGRYRLAPGMEMAVVRSGEGLTAQLTGQPAFPIFAAAPLEFFWRVVDAQVVFTAEAGIVTGGVLHQNGQQIPITRIQP